MCLDLIKGISDDFTYTEEHIMYLIDKYRAFILKQRYGNDPKKYIPSANYSNIKVEVTQNKSTDVLPALMNVGIPRVSSYIATGVTSAISNYYDETIEYIPKERFPFVGNNKFLSKIKYCTIDHLNYLVFSSGFNAVTESNPPKPVEYTVLLSAVLETPTAEEGKDKLDSIIPIEESLIPSLLQAVIKDLYPALQRPSDPQNNANDYIATIAQYLNSLLKSRYREDTKPSDDE